MTDTTDRASGPDRFDQIEALLKSYPSLTDEELQELKTWHKKEASAFDVANMASKDATKDGYARFRAEHIDPFKWNDLVLAMLGIAGILAIVAAIGILAI